MICRVNLAKLAKLMVSLNRWILNLRELIKKGSSQLKKFKIQGKSNLKWLVMPKLKQKMKNKTNRSNKKS